MVINHSLITKVWQARVVSQLNRQLQRLVEEAVFSDRGENAAHTLLVNTVRATQTSFVKSNFQTLESNWKDRMSFLPPKLGAIWKFWPSGAILSFSLRLQDSMAPSGQNFHTAPAFGRRNVTVLSATLNGSKPDIVLSTTPLKLASIFVHMYLARSLFFWQNGLGPGWTKLYSLCTYHQLYYTVQLPGASLASLLPTNHRRAEWTASTNHRLQNLLRT